MILHLFMKSNKITNMKQLLVLQLHALSVLTECLAAPFGGQYSVSGSGGIFRILSHPSFDKRTRYGNSKYIVWRFDKGEDCCELAVYCSFLRTLANKRCSHGDILWMRSSGRNFRFCRHKRPRYEAPLKVTNNLKIIWKTDRKGKERGFECFLKCSKTCHTTPQSTLTMNPSELCFTLSGSTCIFPFRHEENTYIGCAYRPTNDVAPWCKDNHGSKQLCSSTCPLDTSVSSTWPQPSNELQPECTCGALNPKILHGQEAGVNEFPWVVGVSNLWSNRPFCGGVLLSDQYVLSAAHCLHDTLPASVKVSLGDHQWSANDDSKSVMKKVVSIRIHPSYNDPVNYNFDACVIKASLLDSRKMLLIEM